MELYLDLHSQPCRSVFIFAKVLGINFQYRAVDLSSGQQFSEDFGKISLVRRVPVMKDGSFILTESVAILQYLVQKSSAEEPWYPADLQQRARVNEYLSWQHQNLRAHGSKVFLLKSLFPIIMGTEAPADKLAAAQEELNQSLLLLQDYFLRDKDFITGDKISLADLVAIVEIMQPVGSGVNVFEGRPKLAAWRDRVKAKLGVELFNEAHAVIMSVNSLAQKMQNDPNLPFIQAKYQKMFN